MNYSFTKALLSPTLTIKLFSSGRSDLAPTVQTMLELEVLCTTHSTPSIMIEGVPMSKYDPDRVMSYPPKTSPVVGDILSTTGVLSSLYSTTLLKVY